MYTKPLGYGYSVRSQKNFNKHEHEHVSTHRRIVTSELQQINSIPCVLNNNKHVTLKFSHTQQQTYVLSWGISQTSPVWQSLTVAIKLIYLKTAC